MDNRIDRVEDKLEEKIGKIQEDISEIKKAVAVLTSRQNIGSWIFNSLLTVAVLSISGWIVTHFSK